jgi:hypothetical protein
MSIKVDFQLNEFFKEASKIVNDYITKKNEIKDNRVDNFYLMLDMVKKLSGNHIDALKNVVNPISRKNDLLSTCRRYRKLINNRNFPDSYGEAQAIIKEMKMLDPFRKEPEQTNLDRLSTSLAYFQWAVFVFQYDSAKVAEFTDEAQQLWYELNAFDPLPDVAVERQSKVQKMLQAAFDWLDWEKRYVFRWDSVPGSDEEVLKEYLKQNYALGWVDTLQFSKEKDNTINASTGGLFAKHKLKIIKDDNNQVAIEIDDKKSKEELEASRPPWNGYYLSVCRKSKEQTTFVSPLQTSNDVTRFVKKWYEEWRDHVYRTLSYGQGLPYAIGLFEPNRPKKQKATINSNPTA